MVSLLASNCPVSGEWWHVTTLHSDGPRLIYCMLLLLLLSHVCSSYLSSNTGNNNNAASFIVNVRAHCVAYVFLQLVFYLGKYSMTILYTG